MNKVTNRDYLFIKLNAVLYCDVPPVIINEKLMVKNVFMIVVAYFHTANRGMNSIHPMSPKTVKSCYSHIKLGFLKFQKPRWWQ